MQKLLVPVVMSDLLARAMDPEAAWQPFREGIAMIPIYRGEQGQSAALLCYEPGAEVPTHGHGGYEHLFILSGSQSDERGEYLAGTLVVNPPASTHSVRSPGGCIVLAIWERPIAFPA